MNLDSDTLALWRFWQDTGRASYAPTFSTDMWSLSSWSPNWITYNGDPALITIHDPGLAGLQIDKAVGAAVGTTGVLTGAFRLSGDFDVSVDFDGSLIGTGRTLGFGVIFGAGSAFPSNSGPDEALVSLVNTAGVLTLEAITSWTGAIGTDATTATTGRLRITSVAGTLEFWYDTGAGWVSLGTDLAAAGAGSPAMFLSAPGAPASTGYFRNFEVTSADEVYPPALDDTGNHHGVAWGGDTGFAPGALTYGLDLTAGTGQVVVPYHADLDLATISFTIEIWLRQTGALATDSIVVTKSRNQAAPTDATYEIWYDNVGGNYVASLYDLSAGAIVDYVIGAPGGVGVWQHLALRVDRDNDQVDTFLDGTAVTSAAWTQDLETGVQPLTIGYLLDGGTSPSDHVTNLLIDEIRISSKARTDYELLLSSKQRVRGIQAQTWAMTTGMPTSQAQMLGRLYIVK